MRWTWLPRFHPDVHARDAGRRRFWLVHVPLSSSIIALVALPPIQRWIGGDSWPFFGLVLLHLIALGADIYLSLYERWPRAITTARVTLGLAAALAIAVIPGRMMAPLFSFYGFYVLYLTRSATGSLYASLLIAFGPLFAGALWEVSGTSSLADHWPQLAVVSMAVTGLYLTLASCGDEKRRVYAELEAARERERIAANLHDSVGTALAEAALWHDIAIMERGAHSDTAFERARHRTGEALLELRMAVSAMTAGEIGAMQLSALLRSRVQLLCDAAQAQCHVDIEASTARLSGEAAHHLSSLVTEAVSNAARHGHPNTITVELRFSPLALRIRDDGSGFEPNVVRHGHGLASMRARASALGAKLTISSSPSSGTTIEVLPPSSSWRLSSFSARDASRP